MADDYTASTSTFGEVFVGRSVTGTIETPGDSDWFWVSLTAGKTYFFSLATVPSAGLTDPYLRLYNSAGSYLTYDDDSGSGLNSLLTYTATTSDTFYLGASSSLYLSYATGSYNLSVTASDDYVASTSTTGGVTVGGSATGTIETSGDSDWFRVSLTAGQTYSFSLGTASGAGLSDPYLRLYNSAGTTLAYNDDGGSGLNSLITYTATTSGTFYLGASGASSGTTGSYNLSVTGGGSFLAGGSRNDTFISRPGNDIIDGGAGTDTAVFNGYSTNYSITQSGSTYSVYAYSGTDGTDTLQNMERVRFYDTAVALDINGNGGQAYRVYQAAFNRTPDSGGLGYWINAMDNGASIRSVAEGFVGSAEFRAVYGYNPTNAQIVTRLYDNVLHRPGDAGGFYFWLGVLDSNADTVAGVLASFSESAENQAGLVGVIGNGFYYTPFFG